MARCGADIQRVLNYATGIESPEIRAEVLAAIMSYLPVTHRPQIVTPGMKTAGEISNSWARAQALVAWLSLSPEPEVLRKAILEAMVDYLLAIEDKRRTNYLWFCADKMFFVPNVLAVQILEKIASSVIDICWTWHWL